MSGTHGGNPNRHPEKLVLMPKILPGFESILSAVIQSKPYSLDRIDPVYRHVIPIILDPKPLIINQQRPFEEWVTHLEDKKNIISGVFIGMVIDHYRTQLGEERTNLIQITPNPDYNYQSAEYFIASYKPNAAATVDTQYAQALEHIITEARYPALQQCLRDVLQSVTALSTNHPLHIMYNKLSQLTEFGNSFGIIDGTGQPTKYTEFDFLERGLRTITTEASNLADGIKRSSSKQSGKITKPLTRDYFADIYRKSAMGIFGAFASGNIHIFGPILISFKDHRGKYILSKFIFENDRFKVSPTIWEKEEEKVRTQLYQDMQNWPPSMKFETLTTTRCPAFSIRDAKPSMIQDYANLIINDIQALNNRYPPTGRRYNS